MAVVTFFLAITGLPIVAIRIPNTGKLASGLATIAADCIAIVALLSCTLVCLAITTRGVTAIRIADGCFPPGVTLLTRGMVRFLIATFGKGAVAVAGSRFACVVTVFARVYNPVPAIRRYAKAVTTGARIAIVQLAGNRV
jgi:hypothetical protein